MTASDPNEKNGEASQRPGEDPHRLVDHKRRNKIFIIVGIGVVVALFVINSYLHPFWRFQSGYVSEAQFGADWPFTVSEARVICLGYGEMVLETRAGAFGLTSGTIAIGYMSLEDSKIWKWDPDGWNHRVPADSFWTYVNTLCR